MRRGLWAHSRPLRSVICQYYSQLSTVRKLIKGVHHVGVAVSNLDEAVKTYKSVLGLEPTFIKEVKDQKIRVASYRLGPASIELFEPTDLTSTVAAFLEKRGEGMHHIALAVDDILGTLGSVQKAGAVVIDREPRIGAEGQLIAFLHPKSTRGTLVELCQE